MLKISKIVTDNGYLPWYVHNVLHTWIEIIHSTHKYVQLWHINLQNFKYINKQQRQRLLPIWGYLPLRMAMKVQAVMNSFFLFFVVTVFKYLGIVRETHGFRPRWFSRSQPLSWARQFPASTGASHVLLLCLWLWSDHVPLPPFCIFLQFLSPKVHLCFLLQNRQKMWRQEPFSFKILYPTAAFPTLARGRQSWQCHLMYYISLCLIFPITSILSISAHLNKISKMKFSKIVIQGHVLKYLERIDGRLTGGYS